MKDHEQRVVTELAELETKHEALTALLVDAPKVARLGISYDELARLRRQHTYMRLYINVLKERIEQFAGDDAR